MDQWRGKIAVVTGASQGLGLVIATELIKHDVTVIGFGRNEQKLNVVSRQINESYPKKFYGRTCDIRSEPSITESFDWIYQNFGPASILVNNAGVYEEGTLLDTNYETLRRVLETNFMGGILCTKIAARLIMDHSINGHIINICSIAGEALFKPWHDMFPIHVVSKHGVKIATDALNRELRKKNGKIKTTNISPGVTRTEALHDIELTKFGENMIPIKPTDIAEACINVLSCPPNVQISELIVMPIGETY